MKRGIIRIIAGSILVLMQILAMMVSEPEDYISSDIAYNLGFNIFGIVGTVLLIFGIRAYKKGLYSHLVFHTKSSKAHTVVKWVTFVVAVLLFVYYLITFIYLFFDFNLYALFMAFAMLALGLYLLFYLYKKPCCLFSTCLTFIGIAYIYGLISNMTFYLFYLPEYDFYILMVIFRIIPKLIVGILYIVLASKLYKENFSVKAVKVIGWITFAMEMSNLILFPILAGITYYELNDLANLLNILLVVALLLYISVFKINTLKKQVICEKTDTVRFCRKCGNKLLDGAKFCNKCGTEVIWEVEGEKYDL